VKRHLPNAISALRGLSILPLAWLLAVDAYEAAFAVALLAGLSDCVDGFIAKRFGWVSALGAWLDPIADKLFVLTTLLMLALNGWLPMDLVKLVFARDLLIVAGALSYHWLIRPLDIAPRYLSKINTLLEIVLVLAVLAVASGWALPAALILGLIWLVALLTIVSGADYIWIWAQRAYREKWLRLD